MEVQEKVWTTFVTMFDRMRISVGLMLISIVLIAAFQFWWLRKSYREEEETLNIRTSFLFRETIHHLQVSKLKLDSNLKRKVASESDMVGMINVLKEKMRDTVGTKERINSTVIVSMGKGRPPAPPMPADTMSAKAIYQFNDNGKFFNVLLTSDSLQDSLTVKEIQTEFHKVLLAEDIKVPFSVEGKLHAPALQRKKIILPLQKLETAEATIGFLKPITYKLYLRDTTSYLLKKISPQIFFSILLLGITILSFLTLYRNLRSHQKLASIKNEFISNITHELKTPIATVSVAIEAMKNFNVLDDAKKTREYLEISQNELQRLSLLVDKVLKLSMFEKKEIELKIETVDLRLLVEEVAASMRLQLEKHKAQLAIHSDGDTTIQGDRLHFISVIFNLLDNALKYSKSNPSIKIDIKQEGDLAELAVTDNGIGIPVEYKERIFEKFFRVPTGNTHNAKGYGLGLSYVAHVVDKHQGQIAVESQPGIGSRFIIKLPRLHG